MIALRMDDVGSCSKEYLQYCRHYKKGRKRYKFAELGPLKTWRRFSGWGTYRELDEADWVCIYEALRAAKSELTVAVTATWVDPDGSLTPFPRKFPGEYAILKEGVQEGLIEIANHGLTHCVLENRKFLPKLFGSNEAEHREFWPHVPANQHWEHMSISQDILADSFDVDIVTFVPPGNIWTPVTEIYASRLGIKYLSAQEAVAPHNMISNGIRYISGRRVRSFHDRDLVLGGIGYLEERLEVPAVMLKKIGHTLETEKS